MKHWNAFHSNPKLFRCSPPESLSCNQIDDALLIPEFGQPPHRALPQTPRRVQEMTDLPWRGWRCLQTFWNEKMKCRGRTQANTTIKRHTADYHLNDGLFPQKLKNTTSASERAKAPFCILSKKRVGARRGDPGLYILNLSSKKEEGSPNTDQIETQTQWWFEGGGMAALTQGQ